MSLLRRVLFSGQIQQNMNSTSLQRLNSTDPNSNLVRVSTDGHLHLIGINRPEKRNCVNYETAIQLKKAFENFSEDSNALAAVLYGVGGTFCAGYDLQEVASGSSTSVFSDEMGPMGPTRMMLKKPVVAAINGFAVAGGLELALWCDLQVMEETAKLGVYCRRFGVPLIDGGTVRLPKLIGLHRALDLILTGRGVGGREAYEIGLVTKLCKEGEAFHVAKSLAQSLCAHPQACMLADRASAYEATFGNRSLQDALTFEFENSINVLPDAIKGASKFVEGLGRHGTKVDKESEATQKSDQMKSKL